MLTFEQIEKHLKKNAKKLGRIYGYETWELINQVWSMGNVQKLKHIEYAARRIRFDIMDYIRRETDSRRRQRHKKQGKYYRDTYSLSGFNNEDGECIENEEKFGFGYSLCIRDNFIDHIEEKDRFKYIRNRFCYTRTERLVMSLYFLEGFSQREIGRVVGCCDARISQIYMNIIKRIRARENIVRDILTAEFAKDAEKTVSRES